jgi:hypothetical protein
MPHPSTTADARRRVRPAAIALVGALTVATVGCQSASGTRNGPKGRQTSDATSVTSRPSAVGHRPTVSPNRDSTAAMTQTFQANGVSDAPTWAKRIAAHRPYPTGDPTFAVLRQRLAPYHPSPATLNLIVSLLKAS